MTFLLWQRDCDVAIASSRRVLRAAEVPVFAEANALCERLDALVREQSDAVREAAARAGEAARAEGYEAGLAAGAEAVATRLAALAASDARERSRLAGDVASLALAVTRKLLGSMDSPDRLARLARTAADELLGGSDAPATVTLVVAESEAEAVRGRIAAFAEAGAQARLHVRGDPGLAPETCRLETALGSVDASLQTQLRALAQAWGVSDEHSGSGNAPTPGGTA